MKRSILNSPRLLELKKHRRNILLGKFLLSILALLIIFACLAYISRIPSLNISEVKIIGNKATDTEVIKKTIEEQIAGHYLWFFPKTNFIIYPKRKIETELKNKFVIIKDVFINNKNTKTLEVSITEREAKYTWCGEQLPPLQDSGRVGEGSEKCYFLDDTSFIFAEAPYFSGEVYFKFYGFANVGTYFLKENFKQLIHLKDTLTTLGLNPVSLLVGSDGEIKIFLSSSNKTATGPYIIFKANSDFQKVAENLEAALQTEPLQSNLKNKYSSLEYIDLRFGNKVYYKFK